MSLHAEIKACQICANKLPHGIRPVVQFSAASKILIVGQAPGAKVHKSGVPWQDKSGNTLRQWLGVDESRFYDSQYFALVPMGFCYPGTGKNGDLPPMAICAKTWHAKILDFLPKNAPMILVGAYAQRYYLTKQHSLSDNVRHAARFLPHFLPLPHPSPRNIRWMRANPWFEKETLPLVRAMIQKHLHE